MTTLRSKLIRLAHANPGPVRERILPLLVESRTATGPLDPASVVDILTKTNEAIVQGLEDALGVEMSSKAKVFAPNLGRIQKLMRFIDSKVGQSMSGVEITLTVPGKGLLKRGVVVSVNSTLDQVVIQLQKKSGAESIELPLDLNLPREARKLAATFFSLKANKAAAKAPKAAPKLKGKKLDDAISKAYYRNGQNVQVNMMDIGKIYDAGKAAYEAADTVEAADAALDEAMKAAIAKFRQN